MITEKELIERIRENNFKLLGQLYISEDEYKELIIYARMFIKNVSPALGVRVDLRLAVLLVQVAIREYKEGKYWSYFCEVIGELISSSKLNYCGKVFAATAKHYQLLYLDRDDNSQMYVENIKMHAIVTNFYMEGFWDFLYSYYEKNLFRQLADDISDDLDMLSTFMQNTLDNNSDSFVGEEANGRASKSYKLLKATRALIANSDAELLVGILLPLLKILDDYYYDSLLPKKNDRYSNSFINWSKSRENSDEKIEERKRSRLLASKRPYIHFDFEKMMSFLYIPSQKFRETECDGEASATVYINGYSKRINLEVYKSFGIYISELVKIAIPSLFDEIEIEIEGEVLKKYKIQASNYRLLNKNYDITSRLTIGGNLLFVEKGKKVTFEGETTCLDQTDEYALFDFYSVNVTESSIIHIGKRTISIAGEYSEIPYFEDEITDFDVIDEHGNNMIVARSHPTISFSVAEEKLLGTVLVVNGDKYPIDKLDNPVIGSSVNINEKAVTIVLEEELPQVDGSYEVVVDIPGEKNRSVAKYVRLKKLEVKSVKTVYSSSDDVYICVKNALGNVWPVCEDVELVGVQSNIDEYLVPVLENEDDVCFNLELNEQMIIRVPLCIFKAGFSVDELTYKQPEYIWYSDLRETLYCSAPDVDEVRVYLNHDKGNYVTGYSIGNHVFRVDISSLKEKIVKNPFEGWHYINVTCIGARRRSFCLFSVMRIVWVEPYFDFKVVDGKMCFDLSVKGNAELKVSIEDQLTKEEVISKRQIVDGINWLPELSQDGLYNIYPIMVEGDFFGFNTSTFKMRHLYNQSYVGLDDLTNYRLQVADLIYMDEKKPLSYDYFIDIRERVDAETYEGFMYGLKLLPFKERKETKHRYEYGRDNKPIKKKFGKIRILLMKEEEKSILIQVLASCYGEYEQEWMELYYDNEYNTLLHNNDNALSKVTNYTRYDFLDQEVTSFRVMKKKIRRLPKNVI